MTGGTSVKHLREFLHARGLLKAESKFGNRPALLMSLLNKAVSEEEHRANLLCNIVQYLITQKNLCAGRRVGAARGGQRGRGRGRRGGRGWGGRERGRGRGRDSARGRQARAIAAHALAADSSDDEKDVAAAVAADEEQGEEEDEKEEEAEAAGELLGHELDSS